VYFLFEVEDVTNNFTAASQPERVILQFDPDMNQSPQLDAAGTDYRVEIAHLWGTGAQPSTLTFYKSLILPVGACTKQDWQVAPTPAGVMAGVSYALASGQPGYTVELKIPLSALGLAIGNMGISFAVINSKGTAPTVTGVGFPNTLPLTNANNVIAIPTFPTGNCGDWLVPALWGGAAIDTMPGSVTIDRNPVPWNSDSISSVDCAGAQFDYYDAKPCKLDMTVKLSSTIPGIAMRNVLFLWGNNDAGYSKWTYVDIKENVAVPFHGGGAGEVTTLQWPPPPGLVVHPCVRAYVLPNGYAARYPKSLIVSLGSSAPLLDPLLIDSLEHVYGLTPDQWAQENITRLPTGSMCPAGHCPIAFLQDGGVRALFGVARDALSGPHFFSLGPQELWAGALDSQPQPRGNQIFLSPEQARQLGPTNVIVQVRSFGSTPPPVGRQLPYDFVQPIGGVIQLFPVELAQGGKALPVHLTVTNPAPGPQMIGLSVVAHTPPGMPGVRVDLDTAPHLYQHGESRTVLGAVSTSSPLPWWLWLIIAVLVVVVLVFLLLRRRTGTSP
jgi:hypothetical protein